MNKHLRRSVYVDRNVQGRLLCLFARCWAASMAIVVGLTLVGWIFITPGISAFVGPNSLMVQILPMIVVGAGAALLVLPFLLWKMLQVTHQFAGPLVRFKRHLREAADGGPLVPLHLRDGDDWPELADAYNDLVARIETERRQYGGSSVPRAKDDSSEADHDSSNIDATCDSLVCFATVARDDSIDASAPVGI